MGKKKFKISWKKPLCSETRMFFKPAEMSSGSAPSNLRREKEPQTKGSIFLSLSYCIQKRGDCSHDSKFRGFAVYSEQNRKSPEVVCNWTNAAK
jgi:hypothetical protein